MNWSSHEAAIATKGEVFSSWSGGKLVFDSRLIEKGDIYIALPGASTDGHNFVKNAFENGASSAIVSRLLKGIDKEKLLLVQDCLKALNDMANYKRSKSKAKFIGITGSVGKTSTKEILGLALKAHGKTFISRENYNNFLGVPINLASIPDDTEYAIIEMGMDHAGEITPLSNLTKPNIAIITSIENIHRANFDSIEGIAKAKAEIFSGMNNSGIVILNNNSNCYDLLKDFVKNHQIITIGLDSKLLHYQVINNNTKADLVILGTEVSIEFNCIMAKHQIHNMLTSLTCVAALGLDPLKSVPNIKTFTLPRGRGLVIKINLEGKNITLIDDSYNAGPVSIKAALKNMNYYTGRKVAILGDMIDMGPESKTLHVGLKEDIIANNIDKVICFGKLMKDLYEVLPEEKKLGHYLTLKELAKNLADMLQNNDILLMKGSLYLTNFYGFTEHLIKGTLDKIK